MKISRADYSQEDGFLYYVMFKPHMEVGDDSVSLRVPISAAFSVSETGDLADLTFTLPKQCRNETAVSFIRKDGATTMLAEQVLITMPGTSGDAVIDAPAKLDLDAAGRIVGMEIQWNPGSTRGNA